MFEPLEIPEIEANDVVSTGRLPDPKRVARLVREAYDRYESLDDGKVAEYIPALGRVERGLFGFSIVGGGIVTIAPGKGGLGTFAPPLDEAGNSVKGQRVTKYLSEKLGLDLFASKPQI